VDRGGGVDKKSAAAACIMRRSKGFVLVDDKLYKCGACWGVLMKSIVTLVGNHEIRSYMGKDGYGILREVYDGSCGNHAASKTLVRKAYRLTTMSDAEDLVHRFPNCQFFKKQSHVLAHILSPSHHPGRLLAGAST
jgi:hypothetical protein